MDSSEEYSTTVKSNLSFSSMLAARGNQCNVAGQYTSRWSYSSDADCIMVQRKTSNSVAMVKA